MKIILYIAVSIDGYIAKKNGNSNFVSKYDIPIFEKYIDLSDAIIVGGTTFHQYFSEIYPIKGKANIVFGKNKENASIENTHFFSTIDNILKFIIKRKFKNILLVGGGKTNTSFLIKNLINEIIIDIHPIILGEGIKIFEGNSSEFLNTFTCTNSTQIEGGQTLITFKKI